MFDLAVVTLILKSCLSHISNCNLLEVVSWMGHWLGSVDMLSHGMTFNLGSGKVCSAAIFETY